MSQNTFAENYWGWETLLRGDVIQREHLKDSNRPPIEGTHIDLIARGKADHKGGRDYLSVGERIREVYHSLLQFDSNDKEWYFDRALGAGAFGLVASWYRVQNDRITDELVTKTETPSLAGLIHTARDDLSREVWHLAQVVGRRCNDLLAHQGIVQLRGYRNIRGHVSTQGDGRRLFEPRRGHEQKPYYREWRTYMEHCSFGNIARVILTYKAWGYHLPEAFIWHTFAWLMQGCKAMDQHAGNPFQVVAGEYGDKAQVFPESFMLNNDIKYENCFLGTYRPGFFGIPYDGYPAARMGDFGLAQIVGLDNKNRPSNLQPGTKPWVAPEKRRVAMGQTDLGQPIYPYYNPRRVDGPSFREDRGTPQDTDSHCVGPEANTWGVGVIIYLLMALEDILTLSESIDHKLRPGPERDDPRRNQYLFEVEDFPSFLDPHEEYSYELKRLVQECTRLEPLRRPSVDTVCQQIQNGIFRERERLYQAFGHDENAIQDATRVAFSNEEWHDVPRGPFLMMDRPIPGDVKNKARIQEWYDFQWQVEQWADPNAPMLIPPGRCTSRVPSSVEDRSRPFWGPDMMLYVPEGMTQGYWQGPPLPRGGRAQPPQQQYYQG